MRKICDSSNTSCSWALRSTALSRSVPNGFSITIRDRSTRPASSRVCTTGSATLGGTEGSAAGVRPRRGSPRCARPRPRAPRDRALRHVVEQRLELAPLLVAQRPVAELVAGLAGELPEVLGGEVVQRGARIRHCGNSPACCMCSNPGSSLRRDRSPVAPIRTTTCGSTGLMLCALASRARSLTIASLSSRPGRARIPAPCGRTAGGHRCCFCSGTNATQLAPEEVPCSSSTRQRGGAVRTGAQPGRRDGADGSLPAGESCPRCPTGGRPRARRQHRRPRLP